MITVRAILVLGGFALLAAIFWAMGADARGLGAVIVGMTAEPWTLVTLVDLYLGFLICAVVIFLFERNKLAAALWAAPIFFLGNIWTVLWIVMRLPALKSRLAG